MKTTLRSPEITAVVDTQGAELVSLKRIGSDFEYLWQAGPAWARHAPVLFPIVGRLAGDSALIGGRPFSMTQHGFARDMNFDVERSSPEEAVFLVTYNDQTLARYPFRFELRIGYRTEGDAVLIKYRVTNADSKTMWFSIGAHPAFNCPADPNAPLPFDLLFQCAETADRHYLKGGLQSGRTENVLSHSAVLKLTPHLFENDALVFKGLRSSEITLRHPAGQPMVSVSFDGFPYLGLWSKPGAAFVCIEPWYGVADRENPPVPFEEKEGILSLAPARTFECEYSIRLHPL